MGPKRKAVTKNAMFLAAKAFTSPPGRPSTQEGMQDAVRARLTDSLAPEALKGLEEQVAASAGMSGPADAVPMKLTHAIT